MEKAKLFIPTKEQIISAGGKTIADVIAYNLKVLFCGINPGLYSAAAGHHFGRPGNRFWPVLFKSGLTQRLYSPFEDRELLNSGYGITNIYEYATASADEIPGTELKKGAEQLKQKILEYKPKFLAVLGIGAYKAAFNQPKVKIGRQEEKLDNTIIWVLPNPSGLNAHYDLEGLAGLFRELKEASDKNV
jgi:TDG/mug DNA glycosylase family protein